MATAFIIAPIKLGIISTLFFMMPHMIEGVRLPPAIGFPLFVKGEPEGFD